MQLFELRQGDNTKMGQENELYRRDYESLQAILANYPGITIVSVEKDPPEQYVIEYKLFGYGYDANGDVQMMRRHRIQIKLPFGYPHFPPTVKPLTRIFHPDVAEHAVQIADFWEDNQSLADLVVHIGNMIRGAAYSTEGAFNELAAEWYQANRQKFPLGELEYVDPDSRVAERAGGGRIPCALIAGIVALGLAATGGGLFYRDSSILKKSGERLQQIEGSMANRQFHEARDVGREAIDSLKAVIFMGRSRDSRTAEFAAILESTAMREGLEGRVEHQGQYLPIPVADGLQKVERLRDAASEKIAAGDLVAATSIFTAAIRVAEENGLVEAAEGVRQVSATKRLEYYVEKANSSYSEQKWQDAADHYGLAITTLEDEKKFLPVDSQETLEKLAKLEILAKVKVYTAQAAKAEKAKMYEQASGHYRNIVSLIQRSPQGADPVLRQVAADAEQERGRLAEQTLVVQGTDYLLEKYKEIFIQHYPGLYEPGLQSPQVRFMGRNDGKLIFIMSCIELIQRHTNEFRLYYQYDPARREWSVYSERK